jgi:hypothetical protein
MPRKIVIFGNGLGMAIDPEHFSLQPALEEIWQREGFLSEAQKQLIQRCLGREGAPNGEHELDTLHLAITYCKSLNEIGDGDVHWLNEDGQNFPEITAKYIHKVATRLHNYDGSLPVEFENSLVEFVKGTKSHIAPLNYDKLLYNSFIDNDVFGSYYDTALVDGMRGGGFLAEALERMYGNDFGYYLHLHGSPLFYNDGESVRKRNRNDLTLDVDEASEHIVLTHVKHKPSVIAGSRVLSTYWDYLRFALSEVEEVLLFGYSGLDKHLNVLLRPYLKSVQVKVIEWNGTDNNVGFGPRQAYWNNTLGGNVTLRHFENITEFREW